MEKYFNKLNSLHSIVSEFQDFNDKGNSTKKENLADNDSYQEMQDDTYDDFNNGNEFNSYGENYDNNAKCDENEKNERQLNDSCDENENYFSYLSDASEDLDFNNSSDDFSEDLINENEELKSNVSGLNITIIELIIMIITFVVDCSLTQTQFKCLLTLILNIVPSKVNCKKYLNING
jgi:hypothetical protein